jgi:WD40 repeat protein
MRNTFIAIFIMVVGGCGMTATTLPDTYAANFVAEPSVFPLRADADFVAEPPVLPLRLERTIDLWKQGVSGSIEHTFGVYDVAKLAFSPDSQYLAIAGTSSSGFSHVIIWDMAKNKRQSLIPCADIYATESDSHLMWLGDTILLGSRGRWNAMTGETLPNPVDSWGNARLNKDGSKLLTIQHYDKGQSSYINIYDTKTWALKQLSVDGLSVERAFWTADDKVIATASPMRKVWGTSIERHIAKSYDVALLRLDPSGEEPTKWRWFPAEPTGKPKPNDFIYSFPSLEDGISNFVTNEIFLGDGQIIDGKTLAIRRYHSFDETMIAPGAYGMDLSPDGHLLYLKGKAYKKGGYYKNSIVDAVSGKPILKFSGAMKAGHLTALAVSPDGIRLAMSSGDTIFIINFQ